jgi:aminoglycoside phosphotransferase (APT) family kinase protein
MFEKDTQARGQSPVSLESLELVGRGRTAEIFQWDEGRVLRLYLLGASLEYVRREFRAFQLVNKASIPSPAIYPSEAEDGLITIDGRLGFVMDHIDGPTMLRELTQRPWKLRMFARALAVFHLSMHRLTAPGLPSQRERFHAVISRLVDDLGESAVARLHADLDTLEDGNVICHGDFHPDNIILGELGPIIIDWGPASAGAPAADVAWTVFLFKHGGYPPGMARWQRLMLATLRRVFLHAYRHAYAHLADLSWCEVERWETVIAAIRLGDGIPEERTFLLRVLRDRLGPPDSEQANLG